MTERAARLPRDTSGAAQTIGATPTNHRKARSSVDAFKAVRAKLASLDASKLASDRIDLARLELEAMLAHALASTETIMGAAEAIVAAVQENPHDCQEFVAARVTDIFVACAFQDMTAQRARRLKALLGQLDTGLARFGQTLAALEPPESDAESLESGPALPGTGNDQDAVDALFDRLSRL